MKFHKYDDSIRGSAHGWNNLLVFLYKQTEHKHYTNRRETSPTTLYYAEVRWVAVSM